MCYNFIFCFCAYSRFFCSRSKVFLFVVIAAVYAAEARVKRDVLLAPSVVPITTAGVLPIGEIKPHGTYPAHVDPVSIQLIFFLKLFDFFQILFHLKKKSKILINFSKNAINFLSNLGQMPQLSNLRIT